jgi:hypothetical protein
MVADLRGKGVTFEDYDLPGVKTVNGIAELGGIRGAWFKDLEGNILRSSSSRPPNRQASGPGTEPRSHRHPCRAAGGRSGPAPEMTVPPENA